jgi:hypothetical protein
MAPTLSKFYNATHRIPFCRFALQAFFSALAALVRNLLQRYDELFPYRSLALPASAFLS